MFKVSSHLPVAVGLKYHLFIQPESEPTVQKKVQNAAYVWF